MDREEAKRLIQSQIDYLTATLIAQSHGKSFTAAELDQISHCIERLRFDLAAL